MKLQDCECGVLVYTNDPVKFPMQRIGHIVGLTIGASCEPLVFVKWAIPRYMERKMNPILDEYAKSFLDDESSVHPSVIERFTGYTHLGAEWKFKVSVPNDLAL